MAVTYGRPALREEPTVLESAEALAERLSDRPGELDCSGFVRTAFEEAGRPLEVPDRFARKGRGGAGMLLAWARALGRVVRHPRPGDLVFFHDTYGRGAGKVTHVAFVEEVEGDGTVALVHVLGGAVYRGRMSLVHPDDPTVNSRLRKREGQADRAPALAGELFVAYARFD